VFIFSVFSLLYTRGFYDKIERFSFLLLLLKKINQTKKKRRFCVIILSLVKMQMSIDLVLLCRCVGRQMTYVSLLSFFRILSMLERKCTISLSLSTHYIWVFFSLTSLCNNFLSIVCMAKEKKKENRTVSDKDCRVFPSF
jgi:hypothetical protein